MAEPVVLASDLDRTLLPNGDAPESPDARPRLRRLASRDEVTLIYVSGRNLDLLHEAIESFEIPVPDYAIGDVGATVYEVADGDWRPWAAWSEEIGPDWAGRGHDELAALLEDVPGLRPQEEAKQGPFKLSYYTPTDVDRDALLTKLRSRLEPLGVRSSLIWSVDEAAGVGLLDVLPESATKDHALRFLLRRKELDAERAVFAGDSGNDLPALTGGLHAVLVRNAAPAVREEALETVRRRGCEARLYLARGDFLGMNGNYTAGVLEGLAHFLPETLAWLE